MLVINCCITRYSKHRSLPADICYLTLFTCQKPGCGLARTPGSESHKAAGISKLDWERSASLHTHGLLAGFSSAGHGLHSSSLSCPVGLFIEHLASSGWASESKEIPARVRRGVRSELGMEPSGEVWVREWAPAGWEPASCNLITFLFLRSKSPDPCHTHGERGY